MKNVQEEKCVLILENMVFDKISFVRKDFESDSDPVFSFEISAGKKNNADIYKVTIDMSVKKEGEYEIEIGLSGFFSINTTALEANTDISELISKNTVAILMPYMRSELTLLTAQPGMESIVMPPININAMMEQAQKAK